MTPIAPGPGANGHRRLAAVGRGRRWTSGTVDYGAPVVSGGRVYASATTLVGGEPVTYVDQFALR